MSVCTTYVHTWPPPSGNRTVSVKMTSNPLIGFDPAIFNVLGVQETTSTSNCKTKYAYTLSKENFEKWRWIPSSTTHVQIDLWLLHKSDSLSCTFQTHILKQWKINSTSLRKLSRWQAKRPSKLPIIQCFFLFYKIMYWLNEVGFCYLGQLQHQQLYSLDRLCLHNIVLSEQLESNSRNLLLCQACRQLMDLWRPVRSSLIAFVGRNGRCLLWRRRRQYSGGILEDALLTPP